MTAFAIINLLLSVTAAFAITYKLAFASADAGLGERFGLAMIGAAMVLNVGPIIGRSMNCSASPFDDWGATMLRVGLAIFFMARITRHWRANKAHILSLRRELAARQSAKGRKS